MKRIVLILLAFLCVSTYAQVGVMGGGVPEAGGFDGGLISNGDFSSGATDWTLLGSAAVTSEELVCTSAYEGAKQAQGDMVTGMAISTSYRLTVTIVSFTAGDNNLYAATHEESFSYGDSPITGTGVMTIDFTTGGDISEGGMRIVAGTGAHVLDNISLVIL